MIPQLLFQLTEGEKRRAKVEKDYVVNKEELNTKPEVRLQSEINLLTLEKVNEIKYKKIRPSA